ncbi:MAG TPA: hypothetical protein VFW96_15075 [Thermomicrobiales bacterium]|nr:hypothetical protein [Thermomicrobiales bacterium]
MAIVKANYLPTRSPRARHPARSIRYYTWRGPAGGAGRLAAPRVWVCHSGRVLGWAAVRDNAREDARLYRYAYRLVLSTAAAPLGVEDYAATLGRRFARWYLVEHRDGTHPHAHVLAFTDRRLGRGEQARLQAHGRSSRRAG